MSSAVGAEGYAVLLVPGKCVRAKTVSTVMGWAKNALTGSQPLNYLWEIMEPTLGGVADRLEPTE